MLISSTPEGPTPRHPHGEAGWELQGSRSGEGHGEKRHPRNVLQIGRGIGVLSVCVRPQTAERHWHTPSLRGGMLRKGKGKKNRALQRDRGAERGRERPGERGAEGGSGRLADVTSALNQSLKPWSHGCCPLMPKHLLACLEQAHYILCKVL